MMIRLRIVVAVVLFAWSHVAEAQYLDTLHAYNPERALALRQRAIEAIWGGSAWNIPAVVSSPGPQLRRLLGRSPQSSTWLKWRWAAGSPHGLYVGAIHVTFRGASCLVVFHGGHGHGFATDKLGRGQRQLLRRLAAANCDLILVSMPLDGDNYSFRAAAGVPLDRTVSQHWVFATAPNLAPPAGNPLQYFLGSTIGALDCALAQKSYARVGMVGLSGGAWTTTLAAALDPRVQRSYAVAGTQPLSQSINRFDGDVLTRPGAGEYEQFIPGLYPLGIDYHDLYLMAVAEPDRRASLFYNIDDSCCVEAQLFGNSLDELTWYAAQAGFGTLSWMAVPNPPPPGHDIYPPAQDAIMEDFFSGDSLVQSSSASMREQAGCRAARPYSPPQWRAGKVAAPRSCAPDRHGRWSSDRCGRAWKKQARRHSAKSGPIRR